MYRLLKKSDKFVWTDEADVALQDLKRTLAEAPILAAPLKHEPLLLYIVAMNKVVSAVIVIEHKEEGKEHLVQRPVFTTLANASPSKYSATRTTRSWYMGFSSRQGSCATTSWATR